MCSSLLLLEVDCHTCQPKRLDMHWINKNSQMQSAWDMDGRWKAYPLTVLVERQTLWNTASYANQVVTLQWDTTQWETEAEIMREVCRDVQTEPTLLPINENDYQKKVNTADNARLDNSVRGMWNSCEKTFSDIRITYPTSQSYSGKSLAGVYNTNNMKNRR